MKNLAALVLLACAGTLHAAEQFLEADEVQQLRPHPQVAGVSRHVYPGADPSQYSKLIVGSVTFYFADKSKVKALDAEEIKQVSDAMKSALVSAASNHAEVVLSPGPGAALVNVAVTQINIGNKKRGLLGYTPVGLVVSTAANLSGMRVQLKDAQIEGEVVDSVSGERISVFRIDKIGNFDDKKAMSWEDLRATLEDAMGKGLQAVHSQAAAPAQ